MDQEVGQTLGVSSKLIGANRWAHNLGSLLFVFYFFSSANQWRRQQEQY
jgi:hypothetical protein